MTSDDAAPKVERDFTLRTLKRVAIFKGVDDETIRELDDTCRWEDYEADDLIIDQSDDSGEVFCVITGTVRVVSYAPNGRQIGFATLETGAVIGELSAIDGLPRSAAVYAQKKSVIAILTRKSFNELVKVHSDVAIQLIVHLARIIRDMNERVLNLDTLSEVQRVYYQLLRLAEPNPEGDGTWQIAHMPRHKDMAELVGTTPEIVAHAVSQLMKEDIVRRRAGSLEVLDRSKIQKLAIM